jgi:hypothetical protein
MTTARAIRARYGRPSTAPLPSARKASGRLEGLICWPCAQAKSTPRKMYRVPRVTTSDGTLATAMSAPLTAPRAAPEPDANGQYGDDRQVRQRDEDLAGGEGRQPQDGPHGQIDVLGDDDDGLADGEDH